MATEVDEQARGRRGILDGARNWAANAIGTSRSRLDHFTDDVEERVFRLLARLLWTLVAIVSLSLGLFLAMLTVVFGFDLPPRYALGIPALVCLSVGAVAVWMVGRKKRPKKTRSGKHREG